MFLRLLPAILSALVLGAHFLRRGQLVTCALCVGAALLLAMRRPWVPRVVQAFLVLGTLEWARTLVQLVAERRHDGEPWLRMVWIMGSVIAVALVGAGLLTGPRVRDRFSGPAAEPKGAGPA